MNVEFFVPGIAVPGGSKSAYYIKSIGRAVVTPANKKTKPWMQNVRWHAKEAHLRRPLMEGPLKLTLTFHQLRPKGHFRTGKFAGTLKGTARTHPTVKPDLVKLTRSTEDAMTGEIWRDDSQVVILDCRKIYVEKAPGVQVLVEELM